MIRVTDLQGTHRDSQDEMRIESPMKSLKTMSRFRVRLQAVRNLFLDAKL